MANDRDFLFKCVDNVYHKRDSPTDAEVKSLIWPINRFLSMEKDLLEHIAFLSRYMFTLEARYYKLLVRVVPQSFKQKNKYLKVEKKSDDELLARYVQYFKLSKDEVRDYLKILFTKHSRDDIYGFVGLETPPDEHS